MLTFDFETTNLDRGSANNPDNEIVMVSWAEDDQPVQHYHGPMRHARRFWEALKRHDTLLAHNAKFEMQWLARHGVDPQEYRWNDTMLAERVIYGNQPVRVSLDAMCKRYGLRSKDVYVDTLISAGVCPSQIPKSRLIERCNYDVEACREIWHRQQPDLYGARHLYNQRMQFCKRLAEMERNGVFLDIDKVRRTMHAYSLRKNALQKTLDGMTGGINLRSSDQLGEFLYTTLEFEEVKDRQGKPSRNKPSKRWPDGKPKTDRATLNILARRAKTARQKEFLRLLSDFTKVNAALSKALEFFFGVCSEYNCKFHAQFNQTIAATHRLTSSGFPLYFKMYETTKSAQLQNMAREFKELFTTPDPNYQVVEIDHAQLEFRVAVFLGQDRQGLADIMDKDFDAHCTSAAIMAGMDYSEFLSKYRSGDPDYKRMRQEAKADTFKPLYGGVSGTEQQMRYYKAFRERYQGITRAQESWLAKVQATGKLDTPWGMRFRWNTKLDRRGRLLDAKTLRPVAPQVYNYPVQNLATAEITPIAIISLGKRVKDLRVRFVNTVHDSVICYVHKDDVDEFVEAAKLAFTKDVYQYLQENYGLDFNVPLGCEIGIGTHWGKPQRTIEHDDVNNPNWRKPK